MITRMCLSHSLFRLCIQADGQSDRQYNMISLGFSQNQRLSHQLGRDRETPRPELPRFQSDSTPIVCVRPNHVDGYRLLVAQAARVSSGRRWRDVLASRGSRVCGQLYTNQMAATGALLFR